MECINNENLKPSFWAVIPATIRYDEVVGSTAKLLFAEITALSNIEGYCWASNNYFANLFKITPTQVSRLIKTLEDRGFLKSFIDKNAGNQRRLYPQITADTGAPQEPKGKTFEDRFNELIGVTPEMLREEKKNFIEYWTATNDGGKKQHWQKQKTFMMKQRWATWLRNQRDWAKKKEKLPSDQELRDQAKREVERKSREEEEERKRAEMTRPRTPEEQARIDARLAEMRQNLKGKFAMPQI